MNRLLPLSLVLVVLLAGCGGISGTDGTETSTVTATDAATSTPSPTPTATPDATSYLATTDLPAGLNDSSLANASALVDAHEQAVKTEGAVVTFTSNTSDSNIQATTTVTQRYGADGTVVLRSETNSSFGTSEFRLYSNGSTAFMNQSAGGQTSYSVTNANGLTSQYDLESALAQFLTAGEFTVTDVDRSGDTPLVTLRATTTNDSTVQNTQIWNDVDEYNGTLVVDLEGRIHQFDANLTVENRGQLRSMNVSYTVSEFGVDTTAEPAWTDEALAKSTVVDLSVTIENDTVTLAHEGGDTIPAGTSVLAVRTDTNRSRTESMISATLETPLEPGESITIYKPADATIRGEVVKNGTITAERTELSGRYRVLVTSQSTGELIEIVFVHAEDDAE